MSNVNELKQLDNQHNVEKMRLLKYIKENSGKDIDNIIESYVKEDMLETWQRIAKESKDTEIEDLIEILWNKMCKNGGFEYSVSKTESGTQITCTYCPYVELAKEAKATDIGFKLYCASDQYIVDGFNDKIGFKRTKTLMEGHECCNHFYYYK